MISLMGIPVTALITKSKIPYGGVIKPIIELTTTNTPKCTRSIPSALQAGINSGTITSMMVVASKKQPKINTKILINIKNSKGFMSIPVNILDIKAGIFSEITM